MKSYKIIEIAVLDGTPSPSPAGGFRFLYPKTDGWYEMDANGNETKIGLESEGKVKFTDADTLQYLSEKVDNNTIFVEGDPLKFVVKSLDGLETTITELNYLQGATSNIQSQINALSAVGNFVGTIAEINAVSDIYDHFPESEASDKDMVIVITDNTKEGISTIYLYNGTINEWEFAGEFKVELRNFTTEPIKLDAPDKEVTGVLDKAHIDSEIARTSQLHTQNTDEALAQGTDDYITAAYLRTHVDDLTKHRVIDDEDVSGTKLWSSDKIDKEISDAADSKWEAEEPESGDLVEYVKPKDGKKVKAEHIDNVDASIWESAEGKTKMKDPEPLNMQSKKIEGLAQGTEIGDATRKEQTKIKHGFVNRTDSNAPTVTGHILSIAPAVTSFDVFVNGIKFTKSAALEIDLTSYAEGDLIFISINSDGDIQASITAWNIKDYTAIPAALAFKHAGGYIITDERHNSTRNLEWHSWAHTIGTMYQSGLLGAFEEGSGLEFQIGSGVIYDEDIKFEIDTENTTTLWYRDGSNSMKVRVGSSYTFADTNDDGTGLLQWDDGSGTLQEVGNNNYATNWIFASNDPDNPIYTVISQGNYNTISEARNATFPIINLDTAEWKLLYRVIYKRAGTAIEFEEAADFRTVQTGVPTSPVQPNSHDQLIHRDAANSHPIAAITGLTESLYASAQTGVEIHFYVPEIYNSPTSAAIANITDDLTGAKIGIVQKIYHNHSTAPTFPAGWVRIGEGEYTTGVLNIIYAEWVSGTRVEYWITQEAV